ncbi:MAG TPA: site-2 protease family protein [Ktedonobacterales bacterium]
MSPTSDTPEGTRAQPESVTPSWGTATQSPAPYQPYPPQPDYPPPPEAYQSGGWATQPAPPQGPGVYPPPPAIYQSGYPGQYGQQTYPQWIAPGAPSPGYAEAPTAVQRPSPGTGSAVVGWIARLVVIAKFFLPLASVLASFAAYAVIFGWQFGLGIIVLLFVHEMGHFVVIRAKGLPASLPVFIPLLGAYVAMRKLPLNVRDEAEIGIAGPIAGTAAGLVCLALYAQLGLRIMLPLAYFSFFLNLLNLIPVSPLDGARVTSAISKWIWPIGLIGMAIGVWYTWNFLLIVLLVFGFFQMIERFRVPENTPYYKISPAARVYITAMYFGLLAILVFASFTLHPLIAQGSSPF